MSIDWGSVADWFAAFGGWGSVGSVVYLAVRERRRRVSAEERADSLQLYYRSEMAIRAIAHVDEALGIFSKMGPSSLFGERTDRMRTGTLIDQARSKIADLRTFASVDPLLALALKDAEEAAVDAIRILHAGDVTFYAERKLSQIRDDLKRLT